MKQLYGKKGGIVALVLATSLLFSCDVIGADSFIEIEQKEEQYKKVEEELGDLKEIRVKNLDSKRVEEMKDVIYKNYFRRHEDTEHQKENLIDGVHSIVYKTEDMYQLMDWSDNYVHYIGNLFGEDYIYEATEEQVIQEEMETLFNRLGLPYNDKKNGYVIDKKVVQGNNSVEVHVKRYIEGKEVTLACEVEEKEPTIEQVTIVFGNNQIISIDLTGLSEVVEIKDYKEEVFVDSPEKAYKLLTNFVSTAFGTEKRCVDTVRISYVPEKTDTEIVVLQPKVEFYEKDRIGNIYQVDIATKEVRSAFWACLMTMEE